MSSPYPASFHINEVDGSFQSPPPITSWDEKIYQKLLNIKYFNIELSHKRVSVDPSRNKRVFVVNASRLGLQSFLRRYGKRETPPLGIALTSSRPQRVWRSAEIEDNLEVRPEDPSAYTAHMGDVPNTLCRILCFRTIHTPSTAPILAVGCTADDTPVLTVNAQGWQKFLAILRHLLHKRYWFYVLAPKDTSYAHLPFTLTDPYPGDPSEDACTAIECIRLEPERYLYLNIRAELANDDQTCSRGMIHGNTAGLLLLVQWIKAFVKSEADAKDKRNLWNDIAKSVRYYHNPKPLAEAQIPQDLRLRKLHTASSAPLLAFGGRRQRPQDFYIFGNTNGFWALADLLETAAFAHDRDTFYAKDPPRCHGDLTKNIPPSQEDVILLDTWELLEGSFYNPAYNPHCKRLFDPNAVTEAENVAAHFVNERICQ